MNIRLFLFIFLLFATRLAHGAEEPIVQESVPLLSDQITEKMCPGKTSPLSVDIKKELGRACQEDLAAFLAAHTEESHKIVDLLNQSDFAAMARSCRNLYALAESFIKEYMIHYWSSKKIASRALTGHFDEEINERIYFGEIRTTPLPRNISSLSFSPDGHLLASGSFTGSVFLWDVATEKTVNVLRSFYGGIPVRTVQFSPDGSRFAMARGDLFSESTIRIFHVGEQSRLQKFGEKLWHAVTLGKYDDIKKYSDIKFLTFSPNGKLLAINAGAYPALWNISWGKEKKEEIFDFRSEAIAFSGDGQTIFGFHDPLLRCDWSKRFIESFNIKTGNTERVILKHDPREKSKTVKTARFSPNQKILASSEYYDDTFKGSIILWDVATGDQIRSLGNHACNALAFSPCGNILASGDNDGMIRLWDVTTGAEINNFNARGIVHPKDAVTVLLFSPNGKILASGSCDGTVRLWKL